MNEILACISANWIKDYILPIVLAVLSAWITTWITVRTERSKLVNEVRRNAYMNALQILDKLTRNPTLIFDDEYTEKIQQAKLEIEVFGNTKIKDSFTSFANDIQSRYYEYINRFKCDEIWNDYVENSFFTDMFEREEFDYAIENMPQFNDMKCVAETLKSEIAECLRKG